MTGNKNTIISETASGESRTQVQKVERSKAENGTGRKIQSGDASSGKSKGCQKLWTTGRKLAGGEA